MKKELTTIFYFDIALWTKKGDLTTKRRVPVKAKDLGEAESKIEKRYPNAYDISIH